MARVTVEDCIDKVDSPYELVLVAKERATQLNSGLEPTLDRDNDKNTVISLNAITVFLSLSRSKVGSIPVLSWVALSFATKTNSYGLSTLSIQSSTVTLAMPVIYKLWLKKARII